MSAHASVRWRQSGAGLAVGAVLGLLAQQLQLQTLVSYGGDRAPWVAACALAGALLWTTPVRPLFAAAAATVAALWLIVAFSPLSRWMYRGIERRDALPESADAVFVLASGIQRDGDPTTPAMNRLVHGLELLQHGRAGRLVLSELHKGPRYADFARRLMDGLGLRHEIATVGPVRNTHEEAVAVAALCRERGWKTLVIVTCPSHSRRACAVLENEGVRVHSSPSIETRYDLDTMGRADDRIVAFGTVIHEWVGLWLYKRRGWIGRSPGSQALEETVRAPGRSPR